MAANFIELLKSKAYADFQEAVEQTLDEHAVEIFEEFREAVGEDLREAHSQSHVDMVDQSTSKMKVYNADGTEDTSSSVPNNLNLKMNTDSAPAATTYESVDLADVIEILMSEGALTEEDLDSITEEELLELSKKTLDSYINKAANDIEYTARANQRARAYGDGSAKDYQDQSRQLDKLYNRKNGIKQATRKLTKEETEQLDELSKKTLGSYVNKAAFSGVLSGYKSATDHGRPGKPSPSQKASINRVDGIRRAVDRLTKEETEQLDELSKKTLGSYVNKAAMSAGLSYPGSDQKSITKRIVGIRRAVNRLTKEAIVQDYEKHAPIDSTGNAVISGNPKPPQGDDKNKEFMDMLDKEEPGKTNKELGLKGRVTESAVDGREKAMMGVGLHSKDEATKFHKKLVDFYEPKAGDKKQGMIQSVDKDHYKIKEVHGPVHTFKYRDW